MTRPTTKPAACRSASACESGLPISRGIGERASRTVIATVTDSGAPSSGIAIVRVCVE